MKEKSTGAKRRKYDASFKEEVLRMVAAGRPASEVDKSLGIGENLIYKWKSHHSNSQQPATVGKGDNAVSTPEDQQALLLKRIRELEQERDILKKALGIFSRQT